MTSTSGRFRLSVSVLLPFLLLVPSALRSENPAGSSIEGVVRDAQGTAIVGALVELRDSGALQISIAHTDSAGTYRFTAVKPGAYGLRATLSGYEASNVGPFTLTAAEVKTNVNLVMNAVKQSSSSSGAPQFFDEPTFTVAGVTDPASGGGHGSNAVQRNTEALARDMVSLKAAGPAGNRREYEHDRAEIQAQLAKREEAGLHHRLADLDEKLGDPLDAAREYQRAAEMDATESNLFDWGTELLAHNAFEQAIQVFAKGGRLFPASARMLMGLGVASYARGDYQQAADRVGAASDLAPGNTEAYLLLGKMQSAGNVPLAQLAPRMKRFAELQPGNAMANYYYALSLWKRREGLADKGNRSQVAELLKNSVRLDPKFAPASLQLGILYFDSGEYLKAITAYRNAIDADGKLEEAYFRIAQAYRRTGEDAQAQSELQIYERLSKEKTEEVERRRHEVQQFVFTVQQQGSATK